MKSKQRRPSYPICLLLLIAGQTVGSVSGIDIHFDDATSGFFIKSSTEEAVGGEDQLSTNLTVLRSSELVSLRATYGPFLSRERLAPARVIEVLPTSNASGGSNAGTWGDLSDLSAHLVTREVRKDKPVLRVVVHSNQREERQALLCVIVRAVLNNKTVEGECLPSSQPGTCLAQITLPSQWWPSITQETAARKQPKILSQVFYSVQLRSSVGCGRSIIAPQLIGSVPLSVSGAGYQQVSGDEILHMLVPQTPLYPASRIYVPVFVEQSEDVNPVTVIVIKCRARRGVRMEGIEETSRDWTFRIDINSRGSVATVTAVRRDRESVQGDTGPLELFNWLYVIDSGDQQSWEGGLLVWHVKYQHSDPSLMQTDIEKNNVTKSSRLRHRLQIKKDDVQIVLPISKRWEVMNTAVLTGRQVSQPLKIFIVSEAGSVADVTLHTSCQTSDDSALKVSSSCTSVYVDGSETRGALSAEVKVKYGTISGYAYFTVWTPEIPLELIIPDDKLSQINNWRIPDSIEKGYQKRAAELQNNWRDHFEEQTKKFDEKKTKLMEEISEGGRCRTRYQQTKIKVFARFLAEDPNSGRREYFLSRETRLEVTDLTLGSVRTSDPGAVSLTGTSIQGHRPASVQIQVFSPITNKVLASGEVQVVKTKEVVSGIKARVLSGLSTSIVPNPRDPSQFLLQAKLSQTLSSKYQEGLLDITVLFSDGSETPLRDIDPAQYYLTVDTLDPQVIAFAPIIGSKDTRVIAVGRGSGSLLRVSLELADECHDKSDDPLATAMANVKVDFQASPVFKDSKTDRNQLKERGGRRKKSRERKESKTGNIKSVNMGDLSEMLSNVALRDDNSRANSKIFPFDSRSPSFHVSDSPYQHEVTPLEIGMYILLGVFCLAIAVFMASCFVYASKHSDGGRRLPLERKSQSVHAAHDWVWLGRQTDHSSLATSGSRDVLDTSGHSIKSGDSRGARGYHPHRFEGMGVNITQNPCGDNADTGELYGFVNKRGLKVSAFSPDVYAELPRRRQTRQDGSPGPCEEARSPLLQHRQRKVERGSPTSRRSSRSSRPSVNSATYTRRRPVVPTQDILPVGYPVFSSTVEDPATMSEGFQNPWEALQLYRNKDQQDQQPHSLRLDLELDVSESEPELRQSPASGLPPLSQETTESHGECREYKEYREYVPLNPDINKATPPRKGASRIFSDPFNVSDCEAPPVSSDLLSPSHFFTSQEEETEDNESVTSGSVPEDNCSSACSVDSGELEMLDDLPDPNNVTCQSSSSSPAGSLSRHHNKLPDLLDNRKMSPSQSGDLNHVPLGSLDYEQLMAYFETLKESAA